MLFPFYPLEKIRKTEVVYALQGVDKGTVGLECVSLIKTLYLLLQIFDYFFPSSTDDYQRLAKSIQCSGLGIQIIYLLDVCFDYVSHDVLTIYDHQLRFIYHRK